MKYYLHDTNAFNDEKVSELFIQFGYEGLGLFYTILERIAAQEKPIKTTVLKTQLKVGKRLEKCWQFMEEIGIISSSNGETFNERILSYSQKYQIKNKKNAERVAKYRNQRHENEEDKENVTHYTSVTKCVRNADKVKESKVKVYKEEKEKNTWNTKPNADEVGDLPQTNVNAVIERIAFSKNINLTPKEVQGMFRSFKVDNLTGTKYYSDLGAIYSHFSNWMGTQRFDKRNEEQQPTAPITRLKKIS